MRTINSVLMIAYRDLLKFFRDRARMVGTFVFPIIIIAALGGSLQSNIGNSLGYNYVSFIYTGVLAQTLFQSAAFGIISLIEDRQNDFTQEIFVSPVSRYAIILGKIGGESMVALVQGVGITIFAAIIGVHMTIIGLVALIPAALVCCLVGGAFGIAILGSISSQRAANQIFPFVFLPQFFLAGIFNPIRHLPIYLDVLSHLSPMRYVVDLSRAAFYTGRPEYSKIVLNSPAVDLTVSAAIFLGCMAVGTTLFVRQERNR